MKEIEPLGMVSPLTLWNFCVQMENFREIRCPWLHRKDFQCTPYSKCESRERPASPLSQGSVEGWVLREENSRRRDLGRSSGCMQTVGKVWPDDLDAPLAMQRGTS